MRISKAGESGGPAGAERRRPAGNCVSTKLTGTTGWFRPLASVAGALGLPPSERDRPAERRHKT